MKITRDLAITILKYLHQHKAFYFPFTVMCKEYTEEDDDFVEVEPSEWAMIAEDPKYQTFELWENLQNLYEETVELMAKGFIERITGKSGAIRNFIFYTDEGTTFQPDSESGLPDVENCQVLGWGKGKTAVEAFNDFKRESPWLEGSGFETVTGAELKDEKIYYFVTGK